MCPLRYIVLILSAFVAMLVCVWSYYDKTEDEEMSAVLLNGHGSSDAEKEQEDKTRPVDFITGKYLYKQWNKFRQNAPSSSSSTIVAHSTRTSMVIERSV